MSKRETPMEIVRDAIERSIETPPEQIMSWGEWIADITHQIQARHPDVTEQVVREALEARTF